MTRSLFTSITPLPKGVTRAAAVSWLHNHVQMIRLNPLVLRLQESTPPPNASADEYNCAWYEITDEISYLPGGLYKGEVTYKACFNDLPNGLQTHTFAPAGLDLRGKWTVGGNEPGEPRETLELGTEAPREGLYVREDVDMRCNFLLVGFVKKNLTKSHKTVVDKLAELGGTGEQGEHAEQAHPEFDPASYAAVPKPWHSNGQDQTLTPIDSNTMFSPDSYLAGPAKPTSPPHQPNDMDTPPADPGFNVGRNPSPQRENQRSHVHSQTNSQTRNTVPSEKLSYLEHEQKRQQDGAPQLPPLDFLQPRTQQHTEWGESLQRTTQFDGLSHNPSPTASRCNGKQGFSVKYDPSIQAELPAQSSPAELSAQPAHADVSLHSNVRIAQRLSTDYTWRPGLKPGAFI